jgi:two-component system, OmpR family, sensor histidine kinase ChvG
MISFSKRHLFVFGLLMLSPTYLLVEQLRNNNLQETLIDSRVQSLLTQGEIISAAIASSAKVESGAITLDSERLTSVTPRQGVHTYNEDTVAQEFSMNPDRVGPLAKKLVNTSKLVIRVYDKDGDILIDTRSPGGPSNILRNELPDLYSKSSSKNNLQMTSKPISAIFRKLRGENLPSYRDIGNENGKVYPEVDNALQGHPGAIVREDDTGATIISVAIPVKRSRYVRGSIYLTQKNDDLDAVVGETYKSAILYYLVAIILSCLLTVVAPRLIYKWRSQGSNATRAENASFGVL